MTYLRFLHWTLAALVALGAAACSGAAAGTPVDLPDGEPGLGFDDLRYSPALHRVLAPGARSGKLYLVDPDTLAVETIEGFGATDDYAGGHDDGPTSVDESEGRLYVTDRTTKRLHVFDAASRKALGSVDLGAGPDYVRFIPATGELWVTEPGNDRLAIYKLPAAGDVLNPELVETIPVDNGPESLVVSGKLAYTHRWQAKSLVFDVETRKVVAEWDNGCAASRGLAFDSETGIFVAGCNEGTVSAIDASGKIVSSLAKGSGFDVMGFSPSLRHLYLAGGSCGCLLVVGLTRAGALKYLGRFDAPSSTHCAVADDVGHAWVCDPDGGRLWRVDDPFPPTS